MPAHLIKMTDSTYPFGQSEQLDQKNRVLIKQSITKSQQGMSEILRTVKIAKKLSENKILIKLQTVMQEDQNVCLLFEYIPIKVQKYIGTLDVKFLRQYRAQLYTMADMLAQNSIITNIELTNMGLNKNYQAKYFLGLNFVQKIQVNIYQLKNDYVEEIKRIFSPYITSQSALVPKKYTQNLVTLDNRMSDTQQIQSISSHMHPKHGLVKTRKHESIYYEKTKDQQVKRRKQSYMSSVSNLRMNNLYRRINQIQLQVCNTKTSNKNGLKLSIQGRQYTSKSSFQNAKQTVQTQRFKGITSVRNSNNISTTSNCIKYPGYQNDQCQNDQQFGQFQQYQKSLRSNRPNRYALQNQKNSLQMSAHRNQDPKKPYKKFSTQFPTLTDFQQPLMALTCALRISANGLDKKQRKVNKKIEMFKQRQYSQMKSITGNNNYIMDFMSVLEQDSSTNERNSKCAEKQSRSPLRKPPALMIQSQEELCYSQQSQPPKPLMTSKKEPSSPYSHNLIPQQLHKNLAPMLSHPLIQINYQKLKTKPSIQQQISIHNRVKDAIHNSKKLIQKLKDKTKKNN